MSNKYKHGDVIPNDVIARRLDELSDAVTAGKDAIDREFTMRIPAELDRDADLVLSEAAERVRKINVLQEQIKTLKAGLKAVENLIMESNGVIGLHLNGDIANWESLRTGGQYEDWLSDYDKALDT